MRKNTQRHGFTLIELLVVIGVIGVLIAILLPALNMARRAARTMQCAANLRSILQGMHLYASQNEGYFPGGPNTSGRFLINGNGSTAGSYSQSNCPSVLGLWDWQAPIARAIGVKFNEGATTTDRGDRFRQLLNYRTFQCPANPYLASAYTGSGGPDFGTVPWPSYSLAMTFHYILSPRGPVDPAGDGDTNTPHYTRKFYWVPRSYAPKLNKVGNTSRKIFLAEGSRFVEGTTLTYNANFREWMGGTFGEVGSYSAFSRTHLRGNVPGNQNSVAGADPRTFTYRHGMLRKNAIGDSFKMNVAFFDGHVELMGDLTAADPRLWVPRNTDLAVRDGGEIEFWNDINKKMFGPTLPLRFIVRE